MADPLTVSLMEEREELMVSPTGGYPTLRTAHFLKPTLINSPHFLSSPPCPEASFNPTHFDPTNSQLISCLLKIHRRPPKSWKAWVDRLQPLYQQTWIKAGIYEAILSSTCEIPKDNSLIIGLAERWCVETNTFVFPWGEATLTLEDMVVLGRYSVLGDSVLSPVATLESAEICSGLQNARGQIRLSCTRNVSHQAWMDYFMTGSGKFEHEAFLVLWLSMYVLPRKYNYISADLFPVAIHLSKGTLIALGPAVLASIYRDLGFLKRVITDLSKSDCMDDHLATSLSSPIQLVLLWAWKRFGGEPRLGRPQGLRKWDVVNVREALNSARECFMWRPYALALSKSIFTNLGGANGGWVLVESSIGEELESYARCLRVSELVGLDSIEQYLPNRVGMQFGFDQDIPGYVTRSNESLVEAWSNYSRPVKDVKLYVPARLFEADVTSRYLEWYKGSSAKELKTVLKENGSSVNRRVPSAACGGEKDISRSVVSGSSAVADRMEGGEHIDEDKMTISELLGRKRKSNTRKDTFRDGDGHETVLKAHIPSASSSVAKDEDLGNMEFPMEPVKVTASLTRQSKGKMKDANKEHSGDGEERGSRDGTIDHEVPILEFEKRISKLERVFAALKEAKPEGKF